MMPGLRIGKGALIPGSLFFALLVVVLLGQTGWTTVARGEAAAGSPSRAAGSLPPEDFEPGYLRLELTQRVPVLRNRNQVAKGELEVSHSGAPMARQVSLCLRRGSWQKAIRLSGHRCDRLGTMGGTLAVVRLLSFRMRKAARPGTYFTRAVLRSWGFKTRKVRIRLRVARSG